MNVPGTEYIASASSDGFIKVWLLDKSNWKNLKCVSQVSTDARLVCMTCCKVAKIVPKDKKTNKNRHQDEDDENEEDEDNDVQVTYHEADDGTHIANAPSNVKMMRKTKKKRKKMKKFLLQNNSPRHQI